MLLPVSPDVVAFAAQLTHCLLQRLNPELLCFLEVCSCAVKVQVIKAATLGADVASAGFFEVLQVCDVVTSGCECGQLCDILSEC